MKQLIVFGGYQLKINALLLDIQYVVLHGFFDNLCDLGEGLAVDVDYVVGGGEVLGGAGLDQGFDAVAEGLSESRFTICIEYFGNIFALLFLNLGVQVNQAAFREQRRKDFPDTALAAAHKAYEGYVFHIHLATSVSWIHECP